MSSSLRIRSRVTAAVCRFDPSGRPLVVVELDEAVPGLPVHARRVYPDASNTSGHAARALAARLQGQQVEFDALSPRLSNRRLTCLADDFHILGVEAPGHARKDLA